MRISELYKLNKTQYELDFVDIDPSEDKPLFLNPYFLSLREDPWSKNAYRTIKNFFQYIISLIKAGDLKKAKEIFSHLHVACHLRGGIDSPLVLYFVSDSFLI